jgi:riboflavin synthase
MAPELLVGDSLAVAGVCLTVTVIDGDDVHADVGPETARVTTLGALKRGQAVNLERSMRTDGRLGGHFVLGHVDGVGVVEDVRADGESHWLTVGFPALLAPYFIRKGSVAVDGISLTVADLGAKQFDVQVIPYTWAHTTLGGLRVGDRVNIECDMVGKYVVRSMALREQS